MMKIEISLLVIKKSLHPVFGIISWAAGWILENTLDVFFSSQKLEGKQKQASEVS